MQFAPGAANPVEPPAPGLSVEASSVESLHTLSNNVKYSCVTMSNTMLHVKHFNTTMFHM